MHFEYIDFRMPCWTVLSCFLKIVSNFNNCSFFSQQTWLSQEQLISESFNNSTFLATFQKRGFSNLSWKKLNKKSCRNTNLSKHLLTPFPQFLPKLPEREGSPNLSVKLKQPLTGLCAKKCCLSMWFCKANVIWGISNFFLLCFKTCRFKKNKSNLR